MLSKAARASIANFADMMTKDSTGNRGFFHVCSDGKKGWDFVTDREDMRAAFNRVAMVAFLVPDVVVVSFCIEETHVHFILWGTYEACIEFARRYEKSTLQYIAATRGRAKLEMDFAIIPIIDAEYLKIAAAYSVIQPTKDGKQVMPYDYRWGSGSLYFRQTWSVLPWCVNESGEVTGPVALGEMTVLEQRHLLHSKTRLPGDWQAANGFVIPTSYVDVARYEDIFGSCNSFRVFLASPKSRLQDVQNTVTRARGVRLDDLQAREICGELCRQMFGTRDTRRLHTNKRIELAQALWKNKGISPRQIARLVHLPEAEILKYL